MIFGCVVVGLVCEREYGGVAELGGAVELSVFELGVFCLVEIGSESCSVVVR